MVFSRYCDIVYNYCRKYLPHGDCPPKRGRYRVTFAQEIDAEDLPQSFFGSLTTVSSLNRTSVHLQCIKQHFTQVMLAGNCATIRNQSKIIQQHYSKAAMSLNTKAYIKHCVKHDQLLRHFILKCKTITINLNLGPNIALYTEICN